MSNPPLAESGAIDMKALAGRSGMSRATLYRHCPDKTKLEAEIGGIGIDGMIRVAATRTGPAEKFRAAADYLVDHPGEAAAMIPFAARVSVTVLGATVEKIAGDAAASRLIVGIAVMAATPGRDDDDAASLRPHIEQAAALLR